MRCGSHESAAGLFPFLKKLLHIHDQVLDARHIAQGLDHDHAVFFNAADMRSTCPARLAIDRHRTGTANANAASKAIGQSRLLRSLHFRDDIQNRLIFSPGNDVDRERSVACATGDTDGEGPLLRGVLCLHSYLFASALSWMGAVYFFTISL